MTSQKNKTFLILTAIMATVAVGVLLPPSNIDPTDKWSWGENIGWLNWRDANGGSDGVVVGADFLSGYIWLENTGWMNVGNGGGPYANNDDTDYGVNILGDTDLEGYAWAENVGWVNFGWGAPGDETGRAQFDGTRFRGYAWSENAGWINLNDDTHFVAANIGDTPCGTCADCNDDDVCTKEDCSGGSCEGPCQIMFADATDNGVVNMSDVLACNAAISGGLCAMPTCDVNPTCVGNGTLNTADVLTINGSIGQPDPCNCPSRNCP